MSVNDLYENFTPFRKRDVLMTFFLIDCLEIPSQEFFPLRKYIKVWTFWYLAWNSDCENCWQEKFPVFGVKTWAFGGPFEFMAPKWTLPCTEMVLKSRIFFEFKSPAKNLPNKKFKWSLNEAICLFDWQSWIPSLLWALEVDL